MVQASLSSKRTCLNKTTDELSRSRILIIAPHGSYRTMPYFSMAKQLGLDVVIASQGEHSIVSAYAEGIVIDFHDPEAALNKLLAESKRLPFAVIIATDDASLELAAKLAMELGLPHNAAHATLLARRKDLARLALQGNKNILTPEFETISIDAILDGTVTKIDFPVVVKPLALSASRGVIRANNGDEFNAATKIIQTILADENGLDAVEQQSVLVEQFIPGIEIAVEGVLTHGKLTLLAIFDKPEPLNGPYFEETYYITPTRLDESQVRAVTQTVQQTCHAYGLQHGPIHAECRINADGVWIVEATARTIGGMCSRLFEFATGVTLEETVIRNYLGEPVRAQTMNQSAGVLMIPITKAGILNRVEGILAAQKVVGIDEVSIQIRSGNEVTPLPFGASYLGFIFASASSPDAVEQALRQAHACLTIVIDPVWKLTNTG